MNHMPTPHNNFFQQQMSNVDVVKDLLQKQLPPEILKQTDLTTLELQDMPFINLDLDFKNNETSTLFKTLFNNQIGYIYILYIHQHQQNNLLPFIVHKHLFDIMQKHLEKYNSTTLPLVYPLIIYYGSKTPYTGPLSLFDLLPPIQKQILTDLSLNPNKFHIYEQNS